MENKNLNFSEIKKDKEKNKEHSPNKDISRIYKELSAPRDLEQTINKHLAGDSQLRDISGLTENSRKIVLKEVSIGKNNSIKCTKEAMNICDYAVQNLKTGMENPDQLQKNAGYNFLSSTYRLIQEQTPSAHLFDKYYKSKFGNDIKHDLARLLDNPKELINSHKKIVELASDPDLTAAIGYFLADRSFSNENIQKKMYEKLLISEKSNIL